jgi:hypothetical protein
LVEVDGVVEDDDDDEDDDEELNGISSQCVVELDAEERTDLFDFVELFIFVFEIVTELILLL